MWRKTAESAFEHTIDVDFVERNGLYDQLIIGYSFKQDLEKIKFSTHQAEFKDFQPILTTKGICYTFKGPTIPNLWRPSKVTTTFNDLFPAEHDEKYFGGAGSVQGKSKRIQDCQLLNINPISIQVFKCG